MQLDSNCDASAPPFGTANALQAGKYFAFLGQCRVTSTSTKDGKTVAGLIKVLEVVDELQLNVQRYITHVDNCNLDG